MTWRTMEEWNKRKRFVTKGERCMLRDLEGVCLWRKDQTTKIKKKKYTSKDLSFHTNYDQNIEWNDFDDVICQEYS